MSSTAQFHFAAEFVTFLAAAAGLSLVLLRGELLSRTSWARVALGLGFTAIGAAAFFRGSTLVDDIESQFLLMVRAAGLVAVAVGSLTWTGGAGSRRLLWVGITAMAAALVLDIPSSGRAVDAVLGVGAVALTAAALSASRRSIAARVAASAALALLLLVLVLSLALSAVLSSTIEDEALRGLDGRALSEATQIETRYGEVLPSANLSAEALSTNNDSRARLLTLERRPPATPVPPPTNCGDPAPPPGNPEADHAEITCRLGDLSQRFTSQLPLAYLSADRRVIAIHKLDPATAQELAATDAVREAAEQSATAQSAAKGSAEVVSGRAFALGVIPIQVSDRGVRRLLGLMVAAEPLDESYLRIRANEDPRLSLALVRQSETLAQLRVLPPPGVLQPLVAAAINEGRPASTITSTQFVVARPVRRADGRPVMALVASTPTTIVEQTREELFRTLFLIALGGTLLALLIAALVGDRIGAGVRRLTVAAEDIQRGDLSVRSELKSEDEIGVLSSAFDSMAESIEEKTSALRQAADDETRLRNRLEAVVAGMGEALVAVDATGRITDFNQAAEELIGVSAEEARGRAADEVIHLVSDDGDELGTRLRKPLPRRWSVLGGVRQPDGEIVPVALSAGALRGPGAEMAGGVFVLRDLTREREVERMKDEFLSRASHELRTPLTPVIGYIELLLNRDVPPRHAREMYREILDNTGKLMRIIKIIELVTRDTAGRMSIRQEHVNVRAIVDDVVSQWSDRVDGKHSIARRVSRQLPVVDADSSLLAEALHELVDNAVKFSPDGGRITVTAFPADGNGSGKGIEIAVTDQGKGMSPEERQRAFDDFFQGDASDTRSFGGLGLGLALVKRVAEAHGGSVASESRPGKGSKLSIFLPAAPKRRRRR